MGWSDSCQKKRWHKHSLQEWKAWIDGLDETGYCHYDKKEWGEWAASMLQKHGPPEKEQPAQGLISLQDFQPPAPDHPLLRLYHQAMKDAECPRPGITPHNLFLNRMVDAYSFPEPQVWLEMWAGPVGVSGR